MTLRGSSRAGIKGLVSEILLAFAQKTYSNLVIVIDMPIDFHRPLVLSKSGLWFILANTGTICFHELRKVIIVLVLSGCLKTLNNFKRCVAFSHIRTQAGSQRKCLVPLILSPEMLVAKTARCHQCTLAKNQPYKTMIQHTAITQTLFISSWI